jgi:hypothetical protein
VSPPFASPLREHSPCCLSTLLAPFLPLLPAADAATVVASGSAMGSEDAALDVPLDEFGDLCRRNRRVSLASQRALLPPELLPEFGF